MTTEEINALNEQALSAANTNTPEYRAGMAKQAAFLRSIRALVWYHQYSADYPKIDLGYLLRTLDEQIRECLDESGTEMPIVDLTEDWDEVPPALRSIADQMMDSFPESDGDWERFEQTPITVGWGDHVVLIPTCAQSYDAMVDYLKETAAEFEA